MSTSEEWTCRPEPRALCNLTMPVRGLDCSRESSRASGQKWIQGEKKNAGIRSQSFTPKGEGKRCRAGGSASWDVGGLEKPTSAGGGTRMSSFRGVGSGQRKFRKDFSLSPRVQI